MPKQQMNVGLMEKEIRRLNIMGQRVQEEANLRRFFLACVLRKTGPIVLTKSDIASMKQTLQDKTGDLQVDGLLDDCVSLAFTAQDESRIVHKSGSHAVVSDGRATRWYERLWARIKLAWWGVKLGGRS